ncbi:MAG: EamA family transporter [Candidatus Omnitrophota bacterium]
MKEHIFIVIGLIAITDLCDTISQLILKSSINSLNWHVNSIMKALRLTGKLLRLPRVWLGFVLSGFSLVFWLIVLTKADLNLAFSLDSMRYVLIAAASVIFLREKVGKWRWAGIMFVVFGIILVALG